MYILYPRNIQNLPIIIFHKPTMQQPRTITLQSDLWDKTQQQLYKLRQQNVALHARLKQLEAELKGTTFKARLSMTQANLQPGVLEISPHKNQRARFKADMTQWLNNLNKRQLKTQKKEVEFCIKRNLSGISEEVDQFHDPPSHREDEQLQQKKQQSPERKPSIQKQPIKQEQKPDNQPSKAQPKKQMRLIQSICLYGPSQKQIRDNITNRRMMLPNSLLYSVSKQHEEMFKIYGEYFYPEGLVAVKTLRQEEAPTQINQIIFRKNTKKEDCSMFLFRGDDNNQQLKLQNPILSKVNTGRWLSAFFVQFSDFQSLKVQECVEIGEDKNNKSVCQEISDHKSPKITAGRESDRVYSNKKYNTHYIRGKYTLCIFTYFPFINVMESLLSCILDEVKIRRVEKFSNTNQMSDVSIKFLIDQLSKIGAEVHGEIERFPCVFGQQKRIKVGNVQILFDMSQAKFDQLIFSGWAHDILKIFQKDLIFQIFTNMMTQQSICFVSQNMHLLTYVIFFFVCVLTFPFAYPHPCISSVSNYELLESPFVVVAGINQGSKWLEENVSAYPKKIFVDLNDEAKVKGKKKPKSIKSEKLKKIFNSLYKKIQANNSPVPQIFKKKQTIIRPASKQQNTTAIAFLKSLQSYYSEQLFIFLPNPAIISHIRDKIEEKNETSKIFSILKEIEKYLKESRKHREKDQFIDLLIQQQIFYVYMGAKYQLD